MKSEHKDLRIEQQKKMAEIALSKEEAREITERINLEKIDRLTYLLESVTVKPSQIPGGECNIVSALTDKETLKVKTKLFELIHKL